MLCDGCNETSAERIPGGAYAYTSYDSSGVALVKGWLTIIVSDSGTVSGEWHFVPIGAPRQVGPQTGDGMLVGGTDDGKLWIELNPRVRNNNLQLNGTHADGRCAGQWTWISYTGMANGGTFEALRK